MLSLVNHSTYPASRWIEKAGPNFHRPKSIWIISGASQQKVPLIYVHSKFNYSIVHGSLEHSEIFLSVNASPIFRILNARAPNCFASTCFSSSRRFEPWDRPSSYHGICGPSTSPSKISNIQQLGQCSPGFSYTRH